MENRGKGGGGRGVRLIGSEIRREGLWWSGCVLGMAWTCLFLCCIIGKRNYCLIPEHYIP
jgi:hypothetical protein